NWHSPPLSERWLVHGTGMVSGEHQFAATLMGASRWLDLRAPPPYRRIGIRRHYPSVGWSTERETVTGEHQFAATLMGASRCAEVRAPGRTELQFALKTARKPFSA
ncbi:MAG: hypothetical protein ACYDC1_10555, partial [Limisphaerales bacterium]